MAVPTQTNASSPEAFLVVFIVAIVALLYVLKKRGLLPPSPFAKKSKVKDGSTLLQLTLPPPLVERMEVLKKVTGAEDHTESIRRAMRLYDRLIEAELNGARLGYYSSKNEWILIERLTIQREEDEERG